MSSHVTILPAGADIAERETHHREAFLFRLRNAYTDPADTVRRQAERMAYDWWPQAKRPEREGAA